jgi:hypothetical protein
VTKAAKRMHDRAAAKKKLCDEGGDEDEGEEEGDCDSIDDSSPAVKHKPSSSVTPKPKKKKAMESSKPAKDEKIVKPKLGKHVAKAAAWLRKPSVCWETSRNQVMCRTGQAGKGHTHRITFDEAGSAKKAWALGDKWLKIRTAEYQAYHKNL